MDNSKRLFCLLITKANGANRYTWHLLRSLKFYVRIIQKFLICTVLLNGILQRSWHKFSALPTTIPFGENEGYYLLSFPADIIFENRNGKQIAGGH